MATRYKIKVSKTGEAGLITLVMYEVTGDSIEISTATEVTPVLALAGCLKQIGSDRAMDDYHALAEADLIPPF